MMNVCHSMSQYDNKVHEKNVYLYTKYSNTVYP